MRLALVDEWRIFVHPVILGRGRLAFQEGEMQKLKLIETKVFGNGVVMGRWEKGEVHQHRIKLGQLTTPQCRFIQKEMGVIKVAR
jgi:dihydrofolate reductase